MTKAKKPTKRATTKPTKAAKPKPAPKPAKPTKSPAKPLRALGGAVLRAIPTHPGKAIAGVPLPPDLEDAVRFYARGVADEMIEQLAEGLTVPGTFDDEADIVIYQPVVLADGHAQRIRHSVADGMRRAFTLAVLHHADDLAKAAAAAAVIERLGDAAKKGGDARRQMAMPKHVAIRKRFRELRRKITKTMSRYQQVAGEFGMSARQVERIVKEMA